MATLSARSHVRNARASENLDSWQITFRDGFAPLLPDSALDVLRTALELDDPRLIQGHTTSPIPLMRNEKEPIQCADPIAFALWQDNGLSTVGEVMDTYHRVLFAADCRLGQPAAVRYFLNWWDDGDRDNCRTLLLHEVEQEITRRMVESVECEYECGEPAVAARQDDDFDPFA